MCSVRCDRAQCVYYEANALVDKASKCGDCMVGYSWRDYDLTQMFESFNVSDLECWEAKFTYCPICGRKL